MARGGARTGTLSRAGTRRVSIGSAKRNAAIVVEQQEVKYKRFAFEPRFVGWRGVCRGIRRGKRVKNAGGGLVPSGSRELGTADKFASRKGEPAKGVHLNDARNQRNFCGKT